MLEFLLGGCWRQVLKHHCKGRSAREKRGVRRDDSVSRLSAHETTGWKPVVHDRKDACSPTQRTVLSSAARIPAPFSIRVIRVIRVILESVVIFAPHYHSPNARSVNLQITRMGRRLRGCVRRAGRAGHPWRVPSRGARASCAKPEIAPGQPPGPRDPIPAAGFRRFSI